MSDRECYIYVISQGRDGPVKIGYAERPEARLRNLQVGNPNELRLVQTHLCSRRQVALEIESGLHDVLGNNRIQGEWFNLSAEDAGGYVQGYVAMAELKAERDEADRIVKFYLKALEPIS